MLNKKGIWRIVEASLAVLFLAGAIVAINIQQGASTRESEVGNKLINVLEEISKDEALRSEILNDNDLSNIAENDVIAYVEDRVEGYSINASICAINSVNCGGEEYFPPNVEEDVFVKERLISANLNTYSPKTIILYAWRS